MSEEIGEITKVLEVSFKGMDFAMQATKEGLQVLTRIIMITSQFAKNKFGKDARLQKKLQKESGKTKSDVLKLKGGIQFAKVTKEVFEKMKKKSKKYGFQYALCPTFEKDVVHLQILEKDLKSFQEFLNNIEKKSCRTDEQRECFHRENGFEDPIEYMKKSRMATCDDADFVQKMELCYGPNWKENLPPKQEIESIKKNQIHDALAQNIINEAMNSSENVVLEFNAESIVRQTADQVHIPVSSNEYVWIEKKSIRYDSANEKFVAIINKDDELVVTDIDNLNKYDVKAEDIKNNRRPVRIRDSVNNSVKNNMKYSNEVEITISKTLIKSENDEVYKTRIPGMYGDNVGYLLVNKDESIEVHDKKSILTKLDKEKIYPIYGKNNEIKQELTGRELYQNYDKVIRRSSPKKQEGNYIRNPMRDKQHAASKSTQQKFSRKK